jgi:NAD(P)-dependent dehydrogenase (short-subunit alcohol dehydrogenase family)
MCFFGSGVAGHRGHLVKANRDRNYRVVATAHSTKPSSNDDVRVVSGDISGRETARRTISEGLSQFRARIDTLVSIDGICFAKSFAQYTEANFAAILSVYLPSFFYIT